MDVTFTRCVPVHVVRAVCGVTLSVAVLLPGVGVAQALPTPQALAARHDSLVGGRAALDAHRSLRMRGTLSIPLLGLDAPLEILKLRPNRYLLRASLGQIGEILSGYDGTHAWTIQPGQAPVLLAGPQATQVAEQADFFGDFHDLSRFTQVETVDEADFEGRRAYRVRMVRASGDTVLVYYDVTTGLSAGAATSVKTDLGRAEAVSVLGDYKTFGGVLMPTRIVLRSQQLEIVRTISTVEFDVVDEAAVEAPESVKALIKP